MIGQASCTTGNGWNMCLCILFSRHFDKIVSRRLSLIFVSCLLKTTAISDLACIWFLSFNVYFSLGMVLNDTNLVPTYVESREYKLNTLYSIDGICPVFFLNWRFLLFSCLKMSAKPNCRKSLLYKIEVYNKLRKAILNFHFISWIERQSM